MPVTSKPPEKLPKTAAMPLPLRGTTFGGLLVWARASWRAWRGMEVARIKLSVELCTTYWHYLLLVWFVMFALLLST